jgi:hypothetical protein
VMPRFRASFPIRRTPFLVGFDMEARGIAEGDPAVVTVNVGLRP